LLLHAVERWVWLEWLELEVVRNARVGTVVGCWFTLNRMDMDSILLGREQIEPLRLVFVLASNGTVCYSWISSGMALLDTQPVVMLPLGGIC